MINAARPSTLCKCPYPQDPFTPEAVFRLLEDMVLKGSGKRPRRTDPAIAQLALALNAIQLNVRSEYDAWSEEPQRLQRIKDAMEVLIESLPKQLDYYAAIARGTNCIDCAGERLKPTRQDGSVVKARLSLFNELILTAKAARDLDLPQALNVLFFPTRDGRPPIKGWMGIAPELLRAFHYLLPGQPREAAYRFIAAVMPTITNEKPTLEAVKTAFKKKRFVNKGKRKS